MPWLHSWTSGVFSTPGRAGRLERLFPEHTHPHTHAPGLLSLRRGTLAQPGPDPQPPQNKTTTTTAP